MRLRTSSCDGPGYTRIRCGRGFRYADATGEPLTDPEQLARIRALTVPPAWRDVWICPWPNGHLQAVGTDDAGRRQYLYHEQFRAEQDKAKHEHVRQVARTLPELRARVALDLAGRGLSRDRVTACAVRLLDLGFFRIGSDRHTRTSETYGLTTMLREHVDCGRGEITFSYPAKGGTAMVRALVDEQVHEVARALVRRPRGGDRFLVYWDRRAWHDLHGDDLNEALRRLSGTDVTAKDFRTWHATVLAAVAVSVAARDARATDAARRRQITRAVREVSHYLGNTPAVWRSSYIDPKVFELFEQGVTVAPALTRLGEHGEFGRPATQGAVEAAVLDLLDGAAG
ncbi:DNA topoisomerase IB [Streptomyces cyanogenus]|uniref:DNA topoisomerase n=1 Tax=Streptomyces cyanogenus TaxID=80860 RepID=A0ABX7U2A0_STRCY|nr:DNA topoisomerase IB [Streptomyces cyanogenus]QTE02613.1 Eukaryotic DNA topoisomerase I, catalytic core [Streptomyces cyanogenus]